MKRHFLPTLSFGLPVVAFMLIFLGLSRNFETSNTFNLFFASFVTGLVVLVLPAMDTKHIGGKKLLSSAEAVQEARQIMRQDYPSDKGFPLWDLFTVPSEYKSTGIYVLGEMGSGKTVYLTYLIQKALEDNPDAKLVIHDYKMDIHPFLTKQLGVPEAEIKILHPFDKRCCGWDIQADIENEGNAESIANALIPDPPPQADPFWNINARFLVTAGILFFFYQTEETPGYRWGLRELVDLLEDSEALKSVINADPRLRFAKEAINRKNNDIMTTVQAHTGGLRRIANLWAFPDKELVSLKKWRAEKKRGVLILGFEENEEDACKTLNRVLWKQLQKEVLRKNLPPHETWFFLDEFYLMSRLDGIEKFSSVSRSYKGNLVLATQDIAQVKKIYGEDTLNILMQGLKTQIYFRCKGNASQWAVSQIGEQKILKESQSKSVSSGNVSSGTGLREQREKLLMAEDIQRLKKCTAERPLLQAVISSFIDDPFRYTMTFDAFRSVWPTPKIDPDFSLEERRERTRPRPLTVEERQRLGIMVEREDENERADDFVVEV
jgi:hypothetical protein